MKKHASHTKVSIMLHNIRSVHNVGSLFRTADAFGVSKIYISGYTPAPIDRFGRARTDVAKVALGAELSVPWEQVGKGVDTFVTQFKNDGGVVVALEQDARSISCREVAGKVLGSTEVLLIVGNEVGGVEKSLLDHADIIAEIPMRGKKESLNVSVAAGIALFSMMHERV
jgi:tRNA G18 (ribose-2'-O)-methylase SpoU